MNILVTNISYHCAVGVVKLLRKINNAELCILGCSNIPIGYSSGSLLVDKFFLVDKINNSDKYLDEIITLCNTYDIDHIISTDEFEQFIFNKNIDYFLTKTCIIHTDIINLFSNKYKATKAISELGIKIPTIYSLENFEMFKNKKIIIRENNSCCSYGIHVLDGFDIESIRKWSTNNSFIQEYVSGEEYTVDVLCDKNGNPINIIPRKRLAIRGGITYKCLIEKNELLIKECKKIYKKYTIPGFSNVQFIIKNDVAFFIELNPRLGGTTIASSLAGDNLIDLYIKHFVENKPLKESSIRWNTLVTRYYEEVSFLLENEQ